jgi:hypothetical protein
MMRDQQEQRQDDRTGKYGGDDGALEHEREEIQPGEDAGILGTPAGGARSQGQSPAKQAAQQRQLETETEPPVA